MDFVKPEPLFSRQGKATTHMHPEFATGPKRRPEAKVIDPVKLSDLKSMLSDLEKKRIEDEIEAKNKPKLLTSSFRAISRDSHAHAFRNRTESPRVGNYSPRFTVIEPRATHTLKLVKHTSAPKQRIIYLPSCMNPATPCFHARDNKLNVSKEIKRNPLFLADYNDKIGEIQRNDRGIAKKVGERLILPLQFDKQKTREEFVKASDPPNDKRFDYVDNGSLVSSQHKRVNSLPFEKILPRKEFFEEKHSLPPYDADAEVTKKKLCTTVMDFSKMTARKPLVLEHMLKTPLPTDDEKVQAAYSRQSNIRG